MTQRLKDTGSDTNGGKIHPKSYILSINIARNLTHIVLLTLVLWVTKVLEELQFQYIYSYF